MLETKDFYIIKKVDEEEINAVRIKTDPIEYASIPYKDWRIEKKSVIIWKVPIEYCKFRLENGRIKTEILSHQKLKGILDPDQKEVQEVIRGYLAKSDPAKNKLLKEALKKDGQQFAAVITADGFLINGNRRKWALEELNKESPDEKYKTMKVAILPGTNDPERPTRIDIALLENRYQVYEDGKSEYSEMNKALTYYEHDKSGINIKDLLKEDTMYANLNPKQLEKKAIEFKETYFKPIELMKQFLEINGTPENFNKVEDRWQSFKELRKIVLMPLEKEKTLVKYNLQKQDVGIIQNAAFNLIKIKDASDVAHQNRDLIRMIPKALELKNNIGKKELIDIGKIEDELSETDDPDQKDIIWQKKYSEEIINKIKKILNLIEKKKAEEGPIDRLIEALNILDDESLYADNTENTKADDAERAMKISNQIVTRAQHITDMFYSIKKGFTDGLEAFREKYKKD
jgi:hypothetical protein